MLENNNNETVTNLDSTFDDQITVSTKSKGSNLAKAKKVKNDEFYTQIADIERELSHYRDYFKGKTVLCNCDDPEWSSFYKYFTLKFEFLGLSKVITTHYAKGEKSYKLEYFGKDRKVLKTELHGDGDFRSDECLAILQGVDVVVTNPPFSLFREYVALLISQGKKFLIIGNTNAITYKEIFKLIKENKLWLGYPFANGNAFFSIPKNHASNYADGVYNPDTGLVKFRNIAWFTNLYHEKRNQNFLTWKNYKGNETAYPKYDNYDAIEISKVADIPLDYAGAMGVPITFLDKHNPMQFDLIGMDRPLVEAITGKVSRFRVRGNELYARIIIKRVAKTGS